MTRALVLPIGPLLCLLAGVAVLGCGAKTATTLTQTSDGVTSSLPRTGDVLNLAPDTIEGEAVVDVPGATGQPSLRIVTGTVKLDLAAKSVGFIMGPPQWAEVVVRFALSPKTPLRGTLVTANGIAAPSAFDAPAFPDNNARIGFGVKAVTLEQTPSGEVFFNVRVAVRGLSDTTLIRIAYQANILWNPGGAMPAATPAK